MYPKKRNSKARRKYSDEEDLEVVRKLTNLIEEGAEVSSFKCQNCGEVIEKSNYEIAKRVRKRSVNLEEEIRYNLPCEKRECVNALTSFSSNVKFVREKTNLERYGVSCFLKNEGIWELSKKAVIEKYGSIRNRCISGWENYEKRTGFKHNMLNPDSVRLNQEARTATIRNMDFERKQMWYERRLATMKENGTSIFGGIKPDYTNRHLWNFKSTGYNVSKQQIDFFSLVVPGLKEGVVLEQEKRIIVPGKGYYIVDGFFAQKKIVIEYNGDYWHANPNIYGEDQLFSIRGQKILAKDIWEKDRSRNESISEYLGFYVYVVWEKDFLNNKKETVEKLLEVLNE